jgi:membrane protein
MATARTWQDWKRIGTSFARDVYLRFTEERVPLSAGAISFFTLLSLVPLLLLAISLLSSHADACAQIKRLSEVLGPVIADRLQRTLIDVVEQHQVLSGVSLIFGLWAGSQIFLILESAMNLTWRVPRRRPFWIRRGLAILMVLLVGTLMGVAVMLTNYCRLLPLFVPHSDLPFTQEGRHILGQYIVPSLITVIIPTLLTATIFSTIYCVLPSRRITLRSVIPGAVFAAVLWELMVHFFGWYVAHVSDYTYFYGSLGGLVLLMLWFYYSAQIFLLGADISAVYHERLARAGDQEEMEIDKDILEIELPVGV